MPERNCTTHFSQPHRRPAYITRPQYETATQSTPIYHRPQLLQATTPQSFLHKQSVSITPRPVTPTPAARTQLPATTYRPQLLQVSVTPRPTLTHIKSPSSTPSGNLDFDAEFQRFQQENNEITPSPNSKPLLKARPGSVGSTPLGHSQVYSSALVYDPASGQYNTQLYQALPQTDADITLNQRLQPYVHQPQRQVVNLAQLQQNSPLYTKSTNQAAYQQQQAALQFQNSAHLLAQQQKSR